MTSTAVENKIKVPQPAAKIGDVVLIHLKDCVGQARVDMATFYLRRTTIAGLQVELEWIYGFYQTSDRLLFFKEADIIKNVSNHKYDGDFEVNR